MGTPILWSHAKERQIKLLLTTSQGTEPGAILNWSLRCSLNDADHMVRYDCYVSRNQDIIVIVLGVNYEHMNFVILI